MEQNDRETERNQEAEDRRRPTALITGATSGIGAAFARRLAAEGYNIILHGRREEKLRALMHELDTPDAGDLDLVLGDLSDRRTIDALAEAGRNREVSLLINNAGYGAGRDFLEDSEANQMGMLAVHCEAVALLCRALIPQMLRAGSGQVINVSSIAGEQSLPKSVMYTATKSFLTRFTESLALELRPLGIVVQALIPGFTHTDFHDKLPEWERERRSKGIIRWQTADHVAAFSLRQLRKKNPRILAVPGFFNKLIFAVPHILPRRLYYAIASKVTD
jgi:short-subunit dehydrogenase